MAGPASDGAAMAHASSAAALMRIVRIMCLPPQCAAGGRAARGLSVLALDLAPAHGMRRRRPLDQRLAVDLVEISRGDGGGVPGRPGEGPAATLAGRDVAELGTAHGREVRVEAAASGVG